MCAERTYLFIHGFGGSSAIWAWQAAYFQKFGQVMAVDLAGHGASLWQDEDLAGMAAALSRTLDRMNVKENVALVASSFGGLVGLELAQRRPGIFSSMTFAGSLPRFTLTGDFSAGLTPERIDTLNAQLQRDTGAVLQMFFRSLFTPQERGSLQFTRIRDLLKDVPVPSIEALGAFLGILKTADLRAGLRSVAVPVQFVLGDRDYICPLAVVTELREILPSVRVDVMPGLGHFPFLSQPDEFNVLVKEFVR